MLYLFETCEFHPATRRLLVNGVDHVLGGRAFDLLRALIESHHRVVSKEELYERVWPGLAVEPGNLQVQVWSLRKVLGHHVIATVARRGYRFMPAVEQVSTSDARTTATAALTTRPAHPFGAPCTLTPPTANALPDRLVQGLAAHRLVTLTCPDARTSDHLVQTAAQLMTTRLAGRVWQIEAAALTSERLHALLTRIARRPSAMVVLVVLNGHQSVELPTAVAQLLAGSSGLRLLVSSSRALGLPGEKRLTVPARAAASAGLRPEPVESGPDLTSLRWHSR